MLVSEEQNKTDKAKHIMLALSILLFLMIGGLLIWKWKYAPKTETIREESKKEAVDNKTKKKNNVNLTNYQAFYEVEMDKKNVREGRFFDLFLYLTTSGEAFDAAAVVLEWNPQEFKFDRSLKNDLPGNETNLDTFVNNSQGRRIFSKFVINLEDRSNLMVIPANQRTLFYTVRFKALVEKPVTPIKISRVASNASLHFIDNDEENSVNQGLTSDANNMVYYK